MKKQKMIRNFEAISKYDDMGRRIDEEGEQDLERILKIDNIESDEGLKAIVSAIIKKKYDYPFEVNENKVIMNKKVAKWFESEDIPGKYKDFDKIDLAIAGGKAYINERHITLPASLNAFKRAIENDFSLYLRKKNLEKRAKELKNKELKNKMNIEEHVNKDDEEKEGEIKEEEKKEDDESEDEKDADMSQYIYNVRIRIDSDYLADHGIEEFIPKSPLEQTRLNTLRRRGITDDVIKDYLEDFPQLFETGFLNEEKPYLMGQMIKESLRRNPELRMLKNPFTVTRVEIPKTVPKAKKKFKKKKKKSSKKGEDKKEEDKKEGENLIK